jgi:D-alanyl-D-alanine carboxypeptidase
VAGSPKDAVLAAVIARRRKRQKKSAIASLAFIAIVSISAIAFATGASPVDAFSGIPALFAPEATVIPKQQSELQKISPGEKFDFGVKTSKGQELSDPSDLVMFFSNSALCTRPSYSVICINEDAENGSLVEVRLKAGDASETYRFLVCDSLSRTAENGVVTNPSSLTAYINRQRALPADYKPAGLKVPTIRYSYGAETQKYKLRSEAAAAAEQMFTAAKAEGHALLGKKGYQSYADAKKAYDAYAAANGKEKAEKNAKAPGTDEHQTGYALDITAFTASYEIVKDFNSSAAGKWAAAHAYEFGFIQRYPPGSQEKTGYPAEAGHYRYVGVTLAAYLKEANLTLDEFFAE